MSLILIKRYQNSFGRRPATNICLNSLLAEPFAAGGESLHDALYRAYFVDARNISDPQVLLDIVGDAGLSVDAAREVLETRSFSPAVDADWGKSRAYGVTGVPTFVAGGYGVVGAQPYEALEEFLRTVIKEGPRGVE